MDSLKQIPHPENVEKVPTNSQSIGVLKDSEGYVAEVDDEHRGILRTAKDGHTILIPQPTDDPRDPHNWSSVKKHVILFVISFAAFLPDYGSATGAVTLLPQAAIWNMTPDRVNHSQAGNVFMLGAGGVFVVALSAWAGRLPVLFYFLVIAALTAAWCAAATTFESFMAARILNGFFSTVSQGGGLMFISDIFFFHERARKINIWTAFIILSPYMGPLIAAFIISTQPWPIAFWVYFVETALALILTILFVPETYYDARIPQSDQPPKASRLAELTGVAQFRSRHLRNTFGQACMRPILVIIKPTVFLSTLYYTLTFAWVVGINTTLAIFLTPLYNFGPRQIGFFYFTPIIAALLGEIAGHWLHDAIFHHYTRTHKGHFKPEARLRAIWISTPFMLCGLIGLGFALQEAYHYMVTAVFWGLYVFGIMVSTVALNAYNLDSYPEASGEVSAWINFARTAGGFVISYFQVTWAQALGTKISFGTQAGICAFAFLIVLVLQMFGEKMRQKSGALHFPTA
ncbi:major facilitator superfamily domain-containing protein [Paraphoma chrysanthemicola]|uniref:Major facilitator superfamily domain-containing protein n=1 Tax=Paraphoma chrysanthemicola TaxID=798071 RepID=A0A8K0RI94_9PLEO|nr:major facilitator superfamily domain-containing protein [Paraphoma chrysanthemicola]